MIFGLDYNEAIVLAGTSLLGAASGTIGCFAVLRRRALLGDALSHATLPGVAAAFLLTGRRSLPVLLAGALLAALLAIGALALLRQRTRLREDAGIALVLGVFFGVGIVFLSVAQSHPSGSQAGLRSFLFGEAAGMLQRDVLFLGAFAVGTIVVVAVAFKELALVAFDQDFAEVQGWPAKRLDFVLLLLLAAAVVLGLPSVGAILMAAMLVIPSAAARFWTNSLPRMTLLSASFGVASSAIGAFLSGRFRLPTGPTIILAATGLFAISLAFAPLKGWLSRRRRSGAENDRRRVQKLLLQLAQAEQRSAAAASATYERRSVARAVAAGWVEGQGGAFRLTEMGRRKAESLEANRRRWLAAVDRSPELVRSEGAFDLDCDPDEGIG